MPDLISLARARFNLPGVTAADDAVIHALISAASRAIERYCRREFTAAAHDELYDGGGEPRLLLRQYPILSVQAVRHQPVTVLTLTNRDLTLNQQAHVSVSSIGLTLTRVASGVAFTDTSVTFAAHSTLEAMAGAVNALGHGWSAQVTGDYGSWPSADLRSPQGALPARGRLAALQLHVAELTDYHIDERRGWLWRASWPVGVGNVRVQYIAGYITVPEDVQEACAQLVATWFRQRGRDLSLWSETTVGTYHYQAENHDQLPRRVRALLRPYRYHRLSTFSDAS